MAGDIAISFLPPRLLISSCHRALDRRLRNGQRSKAIRIQKCYTIQYNIHEKNKFRLSIQPRVKLASACLSRFEISTFGCTWIRVALIKSFPLCRCVAASLVEVLFYPDESAATCCNNTLHFCLHRRQKNPPKTSKERMAEQHQIIIMSVKPLSLLVPLYLHLFPAIQQQQQQQKKTLLHLHAHLSYCNVNQNTLHI